MLLAGVPVSEDHQSLIQVGSAGGKDLFAMREDALRQRFVEHRTGQDNVHLRDRQPGPEIGVGDRHPSDAEAGRAVCLGDGARRDDARVQWGEAGWDKCGPVGGVPVDLVDEEQGSRSVTRHGVE